MSLRAKLVLALVGCTTVASAAVGVLSYRSTTQTLIAEVDVSLENATRALTGDFERRGPGGLARNLAAIGEIEVQAIGPNGNTRSRAGVDGIPVSLRDLELAGAQPPGVQVFRTEQWAESDSGDAAGSDPQPAPDAESQAPAGEPDISEGDSIRVLTESLGSGRGAVQAARSLEETERVLAALRGRIVLVALAVASASGLAGWFIARQVTGRLVSVTQAAETVAATGELDVEVPVDGSDEAARLGGAFNEMMSALSESRTDQQRLVQDAGHELRTPMTSLRTNLYNLRSIEAMDASERERVLADLESETEELSRLIDEVVEVATDRRGDEPITEVDLGDVASRVAKQGMLRWDREVQVHVSGDPVVLGRRLALTRALGNLVENACKFSTPDSSDEVVVERLPAGEDTTDEPEDRWRQTSVRVEVLDQGPGFGEADIPHVFERFYRSEEARSAPGSGLGLAIVAEVAAAHGGTCSASNRPEGGAAVSLRIPVEPSQEN